MGSKGDKGFVDRMDLSVKVSAKAKLTVDRVATALAACGIRIGTRLATKECAAGAMLLFWADRLEGDEHEAVDALIPNVTRHCQQLELSYDIPKPPFEATH